MKKGFTKALAMFCATAMIVSVFSVNVFAVEEKTEAQIPVEQPKLDEDEEQEKNEDPQVAPANQNEEPVAAPVNQNEEPAQQEPEQQGDPQPAALFANGQITQTDIDNNGGMLPIVSGTYTLAEDITVSDTAHVVDAGTQIVLDLAGYTISYTGTGSMYKLGTNTKDGSDVHVYGEIKLTIQDSGNGGKIIGSDNNTGSEDDWVSVKSGKVNVGVNTGRGGCVLIECGCTFELKGGTIKGFKAADEGGAVLASNGSHFIMSGGTITDCEALCGAGFAVHGATNGTDTGSNVYYHKNTADEPEYKKISVVATATVTGGTITGNKAKDVGGGIRVLRANLIIEGGTVQDNTAKNSGGGIWVSKGNRTNTLNISGSPVISQNTCTADSKKNNLFYGDGAVFKLNGTLNPAAEIYVSSYSSEAFINVFDINSNSYSLDSFHCDNSNYAFEIKDGKVRLIHSLPRIEAYSLTVGGEIFLTAKISLGQYSKDDCNVSYAYEYTKNGGSPVAGGGVVSTMTSSGEYYTFKMPVESACMTAPIRITIDYGDGTVVSSPVTIEKYAKTIIKGNYNQKQKDVAEALLIFGGYAQIQFGINVDALPDINNIDFESEAADYGLTGVAYTLTDPDKAFAGSKLSLLSQTEIKLYFKKSVLGDTAPEMTVSYSSDPVTATTSGSYYIYVIKGPTGNGFSATDYDQSFTYSVGSASGSFSVETYLKLAKNSSTNQAMVNLAEAYYNFAEKCQAL